MDRLQRAKLALHACNLDERREIVGRLLAAGSPIKALELLPRDQWRIRKFVQKWAAFEAREAARRSAGHPAPVLFDVEEVLCRFKRLELGLEDLTDGALDEALELHREWLDIYEAATAMLRRGEPVARDRPWADPEVYYGRFARVFEPFLLLLQARLEEACTAPGLGLTVDLRVVDDVVDELLSRLELHAAGAVEAYLKLHGQDGPAGGEDGRGRYVAFLDRAFNAPEGYHRFFGLFPVLARLAATLTGQLGAFAEELIGRVAADRADLGRVLLDGAEVERIIRLTMGRSDPHESGRTVTMVRLGLAADRGRDRDRDREQERDRAGHAIVVYKPHDLGAEAAVQELLAGLNGRGVLPFPAYRVLCRADYGYAEFLPRGGDSDDPAVAPAYYRQIGGYLALFFIIGGSDLHFENILASQGRAFVCDCETALDVIPQGMDALGGAFPDSVFRTGVLDVPRNGSGPGGATVRLGGCSGGDPFQSTVAAPRIDNRMTTALSVRMASDTEVFAPAANRLRANGRLVDPRDHRDDVTAGFNRVYEFVLDQPAEFTAWVERSFSGASVRFVNRPTQVYAQLLNTAAHPKCLADPLEIDLVFRHLTEHRRPWDPDGRLAAEEIRSLWRLEVPRFATSARGRWLTHGGGRELPIALPVSPVENAIRRIGRASAEDRARQDQYIRGALAHDTLEDASFKATAADNARAIGRHLVATQTDPARLSPWETLLFEPEGKRWGDLNASLYDGTAGIAFFLAYLDQASPSEATRKAAERALGHALSQRDPSQIGAFQGTAGVVYLLAHLARLWDDPGLLAQALGLAHELAPRVAHDRYYDVVHGAAGVLAVMTSLAELTGGGGADIAEACAEHLLRHADHHRGTLSWPCEPGLAEGNLTGYSHGAGGIGWALIRHGRRTGQPRYIEAGRQAYAYEATRFDTAQRNWYDLRSSMVMKEAPGPKFSNHWCNGAAGIGLSRIASWDELGRTDAGMLSEAQTALDTVLRGFHELEGDTLCHGRSGNGDILLRFALLLDEPYLRMETATQAMLQWGRFERTRRWDCGAGGGDASPGLMNGLAGIGLHFLRLSDPRRVPSPLLLDPPPERRP